MSDRSRHGGGRGDNEPSFGELVGKVRRLHHDTVVHERRPSSGLFVTMITGIPVSRSVFACVPPLRS